MKYRWACSDCRKKGRWLRNGNAAYAYGEAHTDRATFGHSTYIEAKAPDGTVRRD